MPTLPPFTHLEVNTEQDYLDPEIQAVGAGSGVQLPIASNVDFIAEGTYVSAKASIEHTRSAARVSENGHGYQATLGVRAMPIEKLELALNAQHTDIADGNETT